MSIYPEKLFHRKMGRGTEFHYQQMSTCSQYTVHFGKSGIQILKITYAVCRCHGIEAIVWKGKVHAVFSLKRDNILHVFFLDFFTSYGHHSFADICSYNLLGLNAFGT